MTHTPLTFDEHCAGIEAASERMADWAAQAGPDAPVPTCPGWQVRDLLAHQGMVHRWAAAIVGGADPRAVDAEAHEQAGRDVPDPVAWLRDGVADLLSALRGAPEDLEVFVFLKQAPPARAFWARRQHHETTVHALDARGALRGGNPTAADAWFGDEVALDAVDELLVGFWQRRSSGPRATPGHEYSALVGADSGERWLLDVGVDAVRTRHLDTDEPGPGPDVAVLSGAAVDLYLALWNRGGRVDDPAGLLERWRQGGSVNWS